MTIKFKPYQIKAIKACRQKKKIILNMGCRTGKTLTALKAVKSKQPVVIGPPHLKAFWLAEAKKLDPPRTPIFLSRFNKKGLWEILRTRPKAVIVDEAHENTLWDTAKFILMMCKSAEKVLWLSATPMTDSAESFYWPLKICGKWNDTKANYRLIFCGGQRLKNKPQIVYPTGLTNEKELKKMIDECSFSYFRKEKVIKKFKNIGDKPIKKTDRIEDFSTFQKIQGFAKCQNEVFLNYLKKKFDRYGKVGILFFHKEVGRLILKQFENGFLIDGDVPIPQRSRKIKKFEELKKGFILLNYKSCGVGIDIKTVDCVIFAEATWSPAKDYQSYMRFYGFKRKTPLKVFFPVFKDEERFIVSKRKQKMLNLLQ